ncbi:MAG: hypothetical protein HYW26_05910 [Candidatus Aenigmarchaeota archaeon]|nr:hypothetical protein [Candidatus Aenigmarchaeota archaeon]
MGIFDRFKKSIISKEDVIENFIYLKEDPTQQIQYEIKNGIIHFRNLNVTNVLGVDLRINKTWYRLCNWEGFHIYVMGLVGGWNAIEGMIQLSDSLKKGNIPDMIKNADEKTLKEIKNYKPPENFVTIKDKIEKMSKSEIKKIKKVKEIIGSEKLILSHTVDQLSFIINLIKKDKKIQTTKNKPVAEIESFIYKKPVFSMDTDEMELKLVRFFILQDKITPEHAKLILPVVKDFLDGIMNQPGVLIPKETIELEIKYFKNYIKILKKSIKDNSTIEPLLLK